MTKVKGEGPIVTANFSGQAKSIFPDLKTTKNLVLLSIKGNDYCTGEFLGAIIKQSLAAHQMTTCLIVDEIYWHNLKEAEVFGAQQAKLMKEAIELGTQYFNDQLEQFLSPLKITVDEFNQEHIAKGASEKIEVINELAKNKGLNYEIVRWNKWMSRAPDAYIEKQKEVAALYLSEPSLVDAIEEHASSFAKRHSNKVGSEFSKMRAECYLREECPGLIYIAAYQQYNFIVYPGQMPKPFKATKDFFIKASNDKSIIKDSEISSLFIKAAQPNVLVNQLKVNFLRSFDRKSSPNQMLEPISSQSNNQKLHSVEGRVQDSLNTSIKQGNANQFFYSTTLSMEPSNVSINLGQIAAVILHDKDIPLERSAQFIAILYRSLCVDSSESEILKARQAYI